MIGILTYDVPHRKTQDVIFHLIAKGYRDLCVVATPFVERKVLYPIYRHRPAQCMSVSLNALCEHFSVKLITTPVAELDSVLAKADFKHILIAGAGVLPASLPERFRIINSHPGYLPYARGLDALKWAIYEGAPVGVTSHFISAEADEGLLIEQAFVPVYFEDTFHSFAYRQYEMEVQLLVNSIEILKNKKEFTDLADERMTARKRMPHHYELVMMQRFEELRKQAPSYRKVEVS